jgi:hypothetical protein
MPPSVALRTPWRVTVVSAETAMAVVYFCKMIFRKYLKKMNRR